MEWSTELNTPLQESALAQEVTLWLAQKGMCLAPLELKMYAYLLRKHLHAQLRHEQFSMLDNTMNASASRFHIYYKSPSKQLSQVKKINKNSLNSEYIENKTENMQSKYSW